MVSLASLQIPYLLTIALTTSNCLPAFPFAPRQTFRLLDKLDLAFLSLLTGRDAASRDVLPGFEGGRGRVSVTEKVRLRGIVGGTRVRVVVVAGKGERGLGKDDGGMDDSGGETEGQVVTDGDVTADEAAMDVQGNHGRWEMEIARVYERTIVELGVSLDGNGTGIGSFG